MLRNQIRIIGGQWRRHQLTFPDGDGLRPTSDRVKETLFNWLGQDLHGKHCLDMFCGSGALSFEAASRFAARVLGFELNQRAYRQLLDNAKKLGASQIEFRQGDVFRQLPALREKFDVIFADPPFAANLAADVLEIAKQVLKPNGYLYLESGKLPELSDEWEIFRQGKAGQVHYTLLKLATASEA
ncbi:16S rRNA (guanine(966)-N(2))-methyltransferase RsmD [Leeia sp. TBRC 13508]|uniref:16S rRNA (Guanine(966)-N(2))-methyltransferase RsmD n=1 Tax=Leeia speluncae TaxID=2884804 RepID=A0ABS8D4Z3_9NEIS|nr:16S rRNA (guanine(966)-N(2))-methyltransferase RsmD [Leeia speluncae]MCB6183242.1 16S rRNA (guanine(966)-N(2))-methyltransferase RsmD [Leeia speluncae]